MVRVGRAAAGIRPLAPAPPSIAGGTDERSAAGFDVSGGGGEWGADPGSGTGEDGPGGDGTGLATEPDPGPGTGEALDSEGPLPGGESGAPEIRLQT
jgi:hypothetical protein